MFAPMHAHAAGEEVITLDTLTVSTKRHDWRYTRSEHFEILSAVDYSKLVSRIMQRAEQIIGTFEKNNPLFRMQRELPAKIIFINDQGIDRYLVLTGKEDLQHAYDRSPMGVSMDRVSSESAKQTSMRGFHDGEQAVFLKLITQAYLDADTSFEERVTENAIDIALNHLLMCVKIQTGHDSPPWLATALNGLRGHSGGFGQAHLVDSFESPIYKYTRSTPPHAYRPAWFSIDDHEMIFGRYCISCETNLLRNASDYPRGTDKKTVALQKKIWRNYALAPNASLGEFLEPRSRKTRHDRHAIANIQASLITTRETRDFMYYCTFMADDKTRAAFARFVVHTEKQQTNESVFKECFGVDYDAFRTRMYDSFKEIARKDSDYSRNPWGPPDIVVAKFNRKDIPPVPKLRPSRRSETARILSDWFVLCGERDIANQVLLKASEASTQARNDPEFVAAFGLSEAAHGRKHSAVAMLEKAMASKQVVRPEAWRTLSRLRLENLLELKGEKHRLTKDELNTVIEPLAEALKQNGASQQTYVQFAQVWTHTDVKLPKEYLDMLAARVRAWPENEELRKVIEKIR
ncbi:hypothetical protein CKA38_06925 [Ereboglobus luteus]|uniref:Uncharacterized protein n=1 Tax=Ereboglobus luteus TaxID=1796921 RepID=A0A2U8E3A6_9BACT|nr:hypothetical protein CKA38_06925 [Ereboglobus luteus]